MLIAQLKQILRLIQKQPLISVINIAGLALGMFVFLLIDRYITFETSFDDFHPQSESIYRISTTRYANGEVFHKNIGAMPPLLPLLKEQVSNIKSLTMVYYDGSFEVQNLQSSSNTVFEEEKAYYADRSFFQIFGFDIIKGNPEHALEGTRKAAISQSTAHKYFGTEDVIGKSLKTTGQVEVNYQITAVYKDPPVNSHFKPELLFSLDSYLDVVHPDWAVRTNWIWNDFPIYINIPNQDKQKVQKKINQIAQHTWGGLYKERDVNFEFELQPIQSIHTNPKAFNEFESGTDKGKLISLRTVSWFTLILAWINFVNLSTVQSMQRAKEVGIRKVLGANKLHLTMKFLFEFLLINLIALFTALFILFILQPMIPTWLGFDFVWIVDSSFWLTLAGLLVGGIVIGYYPCFVISNFKTQTVLKGKSKTSKNGALIRASLVYLQFIITPVMIGGAVLIHQQTNHLINRQIGVNVNKVLSINGPRVATANLLTKEDYFKEKLAQSPNISSVSNMMLLPGENIHWNSNFKVYGDSTNAQYMTVNLVEYDFEKVLDMSLITGRTFSSSFEDSTSLVINESAAKLWGYEPQDILSKTLWWRYSPNYHHFDKKVIGVIADHRQLPYSNENTPMIFSLRRFTPASFAGTQFIVRLQYSDKNSGQILQSEISQIQQLWEELFPNNSFNYSFLDDEFEKKFQSEMRFGKLFNFFSMLSILIAAMGLFALSSYAIMIRTKEFGIRKSLGASAKNISLMIINQYIQLIGIAYLIATPLLYFGASHWLDNYTVRVDLNILFFLIPLLATILIGFVSTVQQTFKAALQNPVESLRYE